MGLAIINGNLLDAKAEAIVLTIDGASEGMEGNIARLFQNEWPDAWEEAESELNYPIALGNALHVKLEDDVECDFRHIFFASTLDHKDICSDEQRGMVIINAFAQAILQTSEKGTGSVATAVMAGGWRMPVERAFLHMIEGYQKAMYSVKHIPIIEIHVISDTDFRMMTKMAQERSLIHEATDEKIVLL